MKALNVSILCVSAVVKRYPGP